MLFMRTAPRRPFAFFLRRREQRERARVRDQQPPFDIGQQNRIGHRVDDVVQQRALASLFAVDIGQRLIAQQLVDLLAENVGEPVQLGGQRAVPPMSSRPNTSSEKPDIPSGTT
jgi:hypothetical protein